MAVDLGQVGHPRRHADWVDAQTLTTVHDVLDDVVRRIADVRLRIDDEPRLALSREDVAGVKIGAQQNVPVGVAGKAAQQGDSVPRQARVEGGRRGSGSLLLELISPHVAHRLKRPEPLTGRGLLP